MKNLFRMPALERRTSRIPFISAGVLAVSLVLIAGPAWAGEQFSNIRVTAECTLMQDTHDVDVGYEFKPKPGPDPTFGMETVILQKHVRGTSGWIDLVDLLSADLGGASEPLDVVEDLCLLPVNFSDANSLRVVVDVEVTNSNPKRKQGQIHTARCTSFPPPACP